MAFNLYRKYSDEDDSKKVLIKQNCPTTYSFNFPEIDKTKEKIIFGASEVGKSNLSESDITWSNECYINQIDLNSLTFSFEHDTSITNDIIINTTTDTSVDILALLQFEVEIDASSLGVTSENKKSFPAQSKSMSVMAAININKGTITKSLSINDTVAVKVFVYETLIPDNKLLLDTINVTINKIITLPQYTFTSSGIQCRSTDSLLKIPTITKAKSGMLKKLLSSTSATVADTNWNIPNCSLSIYGITYTFTLSLTTTRDLLWDSFSGSGTKTIDGISVVCEDKAKYTNNFAVGTYNEKMDTSNKNTFVMLRWEQSPGISNSSSIPFIMPIDCKITGTKTGAMYKNPTITLKTEEQFYGAQTRQLCFRAKSIRLP